MQRPAEPVSGETQAEEVLAVPVSSLARGGLLHQGFRGAGAAETIELAEREGRFLPRARAERDREWKQIIPYVVVACADEVFLLRRTSKGGEPRLHERLSIGVGGHIQREGERRRGLVLAGLARELDEELVLESAPELEALGTVNDDSSDVGQVHFGVVFLARLRRPAARVREVEVLEGGFAGLESLRTRLAAMESWSRCLAEALLADPGLLRREREVARA